MQHYHITHTHGTACHRQVGTAHHRHRTWQVVPVVFKVRTTSDVSAGAETRAGAASRGA